MNSTAIDNIQHILVYSQQKGFKECIAFSRHIIDWRYDDTSITFPIYDDRGNLKEIVVAKPADFESYKEVISFVIIDLTLPPDRQIIAFAEGSRDALQLGMTIDTLHFL